MSNSVYAEIAILLACNALIIGLIFIQYQTHHSDKALVEEYLHKLSINWEDVLRCKISLADQCNGITKSDLLAHLRLHNQYLDRLNNLTLLFKSNGQGAYSHKQVKELIKDVDKFVNYHQNTIVDICGFNSKCISCLRKSVDLWNMQKHTCTSASAWKVIQYYPSK